MHYLDTSILAAILLDDPEAAQAQRLLAGLDTHAQCISLWTGVEIFSAIARRLRTRDFKPRDAARARQLYEQEFAGKLIVHGINAQDYERASALLSQDGTALRSGDALHLAIAVNRAATTFHTLDKVLRKAASQAGLHAPTI